MNLKEVENVFKRVGLRTTVYEKAENIEAASKNHKIEIEFRREWTSNFERSWWNLIFDYSWPLTGDTEIHEEFKFELDAPISEIENKLSEVISEIIISTESSIDELKDELEELQQIKHNI